ncbi:YbaB/EbfC family nucleoid-associated protein [Citroniella saccharovorans]|uniref:Nucleoid-associated protein VLK81_03130 n=1 Tax=Citroniella saccharovorans TaxID=2053367 RepID=A0AAW9MTU5_9FIRM|nr:YbaB/EbfC family nucleoid-associated protein [Citroniella saccharovorans]MEB3429024.1 YbaB/EbfC family nucleoid-associated protein [Citroniella saccharovorans]
MARGGFQRGGNMGNMMKQMQQMQRKLEETQARLEEQLVTKSSGGGVCEATVNGKKELVSIKLDKEVVDPDDVEILQDLIVAAVNEALKEIEEISEREMGKLTGGLNIPGL